MNKMKPTQKVILITGLVVLTGSCGDAALEQKAKEQEPVDSITSTGPIENQQRTEAEAKSTIDSLL